MSRFRSIQWEEWRRNWTLVLACAFGFSFSAVLNYSFGLFIQPLGEEFGWSRTELSIGLTLTAIISVLFSPVVGMIIDRWGVRRLALPGLALLAVSISSFSLANGSVVQWYALWTAFAIIDLSVKSTIWTTAVAYAFSAERSLALAFTLGGVSLTTILAPPIAQYLIADYGWRTAFVAIGVSWGVVAFTLSFFFLKDSRDGVRPNAESREEGTAIVEGLTVPQALRSLPLLRIGLATFITMLLGLGVQVHIVPILTDGGISRVDAAYLASLAGVAGIAGKLTTGWLMDRVHASTVGAWTLGISALAYGLLLDEFRTPVLTVVAMMVIGYAAAAKLQICAYTTSRYAGMRSFGTIFGFMSSLIALGGGTGPLLAGIVYDTYGSYNPLLIASVFGTLISATMIFGLGKYPEWNRPALSGA